MPPELALTASVIMVRNVPPAAAIEVGERPALAACCAQVEQPDVHLAREKC